MFDILKKKKEFCKSKIKNLKNWIEMKKEQRENNPDEPEFYKFDIYCKSEEDDALFFKRVFGIGKYSSALCSVAFLATMSLNPVLAMIGLGFGLASLYRFDSLYMKNVDKYEKIIELKKSIKEFDDYFLENDDDTNKEVSSDVKSTKLDSCKKFINNLNIFSNEKTVKLTRDEKIAKVKDECKLGRFRIKDVTSYCVMVAKDDIKLQRFIRSEYKKENPKERIHSFVAGNTKVLVLNNKPIFK